MVLVLLFTMVFNRSLWTQTLWL